MPFYSKPFLLNTPHYARTRRPSKSPSLPTVHHREIHDLVQLDEACLQRRNVLTANPRFICLALYFCSNSNWHKDSQRKAVLALLHDLAHASFVDPPWEELQRCLIYKHIPSNLTPFTTCGKILAHSRQKVTAFREYLGINVAVFKIGVTGNPAQRFEQYLKVNFTMMWVIFKSNDLSIVHMLEASLIALFNDCTGCRNAPNTGGEGALNRRRSPDPPFFVYVVGGRADQLKKVG